MIRIKVQSEPNGKLAVSVPYDSDALAKIKTVEGRRWDPSRQVWIVPATDNMVPRLQHLFGQDHVDVDSSLLKRASAATKVTDGDVVDLTLPAHVYPFDETHLNEICGALADTVTGLTGGEIGGILEQLTYEDPLPSATKRYRLSAALQLAQQSKGSGEPVLKFIEVVMNPVRYSAKPEQYSVKSGRLNRVLAFSGYRVDDTGRVQATSVVRTLAEAQARADGLRDELANRKVHPDVLRCCKAELLQDNYFHAVFEATKSVADKIRQKSGLAGDGAHLVQHALGGENPIIAINSMISETQKSEQKGFVSLLTGMCGVFRNTLAHEPRLTWPIDEQDALDLLSLAAYLHRRLDASIPRNRP
jgi:uncharacterized protein (TIGR02391 family)